MPYIIFVVSRFGLILGLLILKHTIHLPRDFKENYTTFSKLYYIINRQKKGLYEKLRTERMMLIHFMFDRN